MHKVIQLALITGTLLASSCAYSREYCTETYVDNTGKHTCLSTNLRSNLSSGNAFEDGKAVYDKQCASCHDNAAGRTPTKKMLNDLSAQAIVTSLETGVMRVIGQWNMDGSQRVAVAEYLSGEKYDAVSDPLTVKERNANRLAKQKELATQQKARVKQTCLEFGFSEGTTEFASCQLDLYKLELVQGQNTQMLETIDKNAAAERAQAKKLAVEERAQIQKLADEQEARRKSQAMGAALLGISKSLLTPPPQPERYDTDCTTYGNNTDCTTRRR